MIGEVVVPPSRKLEDLIRLAELCVDLLRQNEEFYAEVKQLREKYENIFNVVIIFIVYISVSDSKSQGWPTISISCRLEEQIIFLFYCFIYSSWPSHTPMTVHNCNYQSVIDNDCCLSFHRETCFFC